MYSLNQATKIANSIVETLQPHCKVINIAGSIRRQKQEVKDIEIVAIPKKLTQGGNTLFGHEETITTVHPEFVKAVKAIGKIVKGNPEGRYMQISKTYINNLIMVDLFLPDEPDYYRQYAIRTGSAEYAQKVIAAGWLKQGWCGSDKGLRKQSDCVHKVVDGKNKWTCVNPSAEKPPIWTNEAHFFAWLGVEWIEPKLRNTHVYY